MPYFPHRAFVRGSSKHSAFLKRLLTEEWQRLRRARKAR